MVHYNRYMVEFLKKEEKKILDKSKKIINIELRNLLRDDDSFLY